MNVMIAAAAGGFGDMVRDTADTFGWNPWLFLSQVLSFSIVALLLKRFAYKPILAVLEDRRHRIEEGLLNAEKIKKTGGGRATLRGDSGQGERGRTKDDR
jgi:F-type H+-transporting ATPase subunit b